MAPHLSTVRAGVASRGAQYTGCRFCAAVKRGRRQREGTAQKADVILGHLSVGDPWANAGLDVLLLGELLARIGGSAVVATAPSFMRGGRSHQSLMTALHAAGFVPMAGHTVVADAALVPALSGPAGQDLIRRYEAEAAR
ncbi:MULTISPECIES: hypothetical protein [unclassified Kitasatospora]|uniref:hypothetical protein n=1 Tax=unclassified Kitasatospora TaxID=2633591 RepID=UPI0033D521C9